MSLCERGGVNMDIKIKIFNKKYRLRAGGAAWWICMILCRAATLAAMYGAFYAFLLGIVNLGGDMLIILIIINIILLCVAYF